MATSNPKRIAVIDDEIDTLVLIHAILSEQYEVATCNDPAQALEFIKQIKPHVVILDLMMPGMGGWEVYNQMQRDELTVDIPVIISTASLETVDKVFALHIAHVSAFIAKPFTTERLLSCVANALENADSAD